VTGRLFKARDSAALASRLEEYLLDERLRRRHGAAARQSAVSRFSLATMVVSYGAVYGRLCGIDGGAA
jgi:glycosyltransferase involved in cell wall biosynthesis